MTQDRAIAKDKVTDSETSNDSCSELEEAYNMLPIGYTVDKDKNLSRIVNSEKVFIQKLQRQIYKMIEYSDQTYFIDVFGDCFVIDELPKFLFGILSKPIFFAITQERIYTIDKYSRVWMHGLDGEIQSIVFIGERIHSAWISDSYCAVVTNGEKNIIEYRVEMECKERKLMIFDDKFNPSQTIEIEKLIAYEENGVKYVFSGETKYFEAKK